MKTLNYDSLKLNVVARFALRDLIIYMVNAN